MRVSSRASRSCPSTSPRPRRCSLRSVPKAKQEIALVTAPVYDQRVVQALQQMLVDAGLNVKIEMTDMGSWLKRMQSGPDSIPVMAFSRWSCGCQDADGVLFPILHSASGWANAKDKAIDEALEAGAPDARSGQAPRRLQDRARAHRQRELRHPALSGGADVRRRQEPRTGRRRPTKASSSTA